MLDLDKLEQTEIDRNDGVTKKAPRKPRPSELAAKAAKLASATAKATSATVAATKKPKAKKSAKKALAGKSKKAKGKTFPRRKARNQSEAKKAVRGARPLVRTARLDIRCLPKQRAVIVAAAKRKGQTLTQLVMGVLSKIK